MILPFNTAERKVLGVAAAGVAPARTSALFTQVPASNPFGSAPKITGVVNMIFVKAKSADSVDDAMAQITKTLHDRHRIQPKQDNDFTVRSLSDIAFQPVPEF